METAKQAEGLKQEIGEGRDVLRNIVGRRIQRGKRRLVRGIEGRAKAFGRGARLGYAIQENPARAAVVTFVLGCAIGAIVLGLTQVLGEEMSEESEGQGYESEAA